MKRLISILLALLVLAGLTVTAFAAESSVTYEGGAEKFVFLDDDDLFDNFKGLMPGDTATQTITITNNVGNKAYVAIYMRAVPHDENNLPISGQDLAAMSDFLSQLSMTVRQGDKVLFEAKASELDGLEENVLLGSFHKGTTTELTVELHVPLELGNEYANRVGEVDWVFLAEEVDKPVSPETGDDFILWPFLVIMILSFGAIMFLIIVKRRRNSSQ